MASRQVLSPRHRDELARSNAVVIAVASQSCSARCMFLLVSRLSCILGEWINAIYWPDASWSANALERPSKCTVL